MGMQVASLPVGTNIAVSPQQNQYEKQPPLPVEQKAAIKEPEITLPGTKKPPSTLEQTTLELEHISLAFNRRLKFVIDHESMEIIVKVIDNETDKVIKVLPPEELQRLHSRIKETLGFLLDKMV